MSPGGTGKSEKAVEGGRHPFLLLVKAIQWLAIRIVFTRKLTIDSIKTIPG